MTTTTVPTIDIDTTNDLLRQHLDRGGQFRFIQSFGADGYGKSVWSSTDKPLRSVATLDGVRQVYWGVNPTTCPVTDKDRKNNPGKTDKQIEPNVASKNNTIAAVNALYAEFDGKDFTNPSPAEIDDQYALIKVAAPDVDDKSLWTQAKSQAKEVKFLTDISGFKALALKHIRALKIKPSMLIDSGGGYQAYWLLAEPYIIDSEDKREFIKWLQAAWVEYVGGDMGAKDLRRILRVPGLRNIKKAYGPNFPVVSYVAADLDLTYSIADFAALVPPRPVVEPRQQKTGGAFNAQRNGNGYNGDSPIDTFNAVYKIADVLQDCGYTWVGDRMAKPGGKNPTVEIYEDDNESFHFGGGDPLHTDHRVKPFSAYLYYKHGGNMKEAVKAAARELGMDYKSNGAYDGFAHGNPLGLMNGTPQTGAELIADIQTAAKSIDTATGEILSDGTATATRIATLQIGTNVIWHADAGDMPATITSYMGYIGNENYYNINVHVPGWESAGGQPQSKLSVVDGVALDDVMLHGSPKYRIGQQVNRWSADNPEEMELIDAGAITSIHCGKKGWEYTTTLGGVLTQTMIKPLVKSTSYTMELPQKYQKPVEPIALPDISAAPDLPEWAKLSADELTEAAHTGKFLRQYIEFAKDASPMTPIQFNVSAGLAAVAIAIARRVHVRVGASKIYPNLYQIYVGPSTLQRKTTGMNTLTNLMDLAGMIPIFTLAETQTPEAFVEDMTMNLPATYDRMSPTARAVWLDRRRLFAQRGWIIDEASRLLDSFNRDYTAGLLPIVLDLYDSKDRSGERNTKSWGNESIEKAYLNIFGATTFSSIGKHVADPERWGDGFFARFSFTASNEPGAWQFWPEPMDYPRPLVDELYRIAFRIFGPPPLTSTVTNENKDEDGKSLGRPTISIEIEQLKDNAARFGAGAFEMWERYSKATGYDMLLQAAKDNSIPVEMFPSYGRLGTMLVKVAMLFAVMDAQTSQIVIERKHIAAAQRVVEMWRESLHIVKAGGQVTAAKTFVDKVLATLSKNGENWTIRRDLQHALGCSWAELEPAIDDLHGAGLVERTSYAAKRGPKSEMYRVVVSE